MLGLLALDAVAYQCACQQRIFALVLKGSSVARLAGQIDPTAERHVVALSAEFPADQRAVFAGSFGIPGGGSGDVGGQGSGVTAVLGAHPDPVGSVTHLDLRNAEAGNPKDEARALI